MTHDEIRDLLAGYAVDALANDEAAAVAGHLKGCAECSAELRTLSAAVDALAEAVPPLVAPERLRARMLLDAPAAPALPIGLMASPTPGRFQRAARFALRVWPPQASQRVRQATSLAAVLVLTALSATTLSVLNTNRQTEQELVDNRAALGLLTSTETANDPLVRVSTALPGEAHGHWFHRPGVMTQVVVGERLPSPSPGERYQVWMRLERDWTPVGDLKVDDAGYGRLVIMGVAASAVRDVVVTLETVSTAQPGPAVMLRSPPASE